MAKQKVPKWQKRTPSTDETVLAEWQARYSELRDMDYSKCDAIAQIANEANLHFNTVYRHMTPQVNEQQKKYQKGRWQKEKINPQTRDKIVGYKGNYQILRRHIDDAVRQAFSETGHPLTMDEISDAIRQQHSVSMAPATICGLVARYESKYVTQLLHELPTQPPSYVLAPGYRTRKR